MSFKKCYTFDLHGYIVSSKTDSQNADFLTHVHLSNVSE